MASYTDKIPTFNPYVAQQPVEAMLKVGMYKQQKYEEGVQKIQTSIDNIAGLDIANPAQQKYLQSKLNALGNNLTFLAAGDFSDFSLVNSVNGMTKQITKDDTVINAVNSTAKLRKEQKRKEKAIQDGKSSPENEYVFNLQASDYINNSDVGASYNGQYIEYKDVDKKLRALALDLQKAGVDTTIDNPFKRDNVTGKTLYYNKDGSVSTDPSKGGTPQIATSMLKTTVRGIGAEKLLNNFYDSLDETDKRQLNITAQYHYRNSDSASIQNDIIKTYEQKKKIYSDAIVDASVKLATADLTKEQKTMLENEINKAKALVYDGGFDKQMAEELATVDTEAEADVYKYKTYTQKYLTNLAKDVANETISTEYEDNPDFKAMMDQKKLQFDIQKANQEHQEWLADHMLAKDKFAYEKLKDAKTDAANQPLVTPGALNTDLPPVTLFDVGLEIQSLNKDKQVVNNKYASVLFPDLKGYVINDLGQKVTAQQNALDKLYDNYKRNPQKSLTPNQKEYLKERTIVETNLTDKNNLYNSTMKLTSGLSKDVDKVFNTQLGIKIGQQSYSAKDLYNFQGSTDKYIYRYKVRDGEGGFIERSKMSDDILRQYKGTKNYPIALAIYKDYNNKSLSDNEKVIVNQLKKINSNVSSSVKGINQKILKTQSEYIMSKMPEYQTQVGTVNLANEGVVNKLNALLTLKATQYAQYGALDQDKPNDYDPDEVVKIRKNESKSAGYQIVKKYDGSATLILTDGKTVQKVPVSQAEMNIYFPEYSRRNVVSDIKSAVIASPNMTTNLAGTMDPVNARMTGFSLPGLAGSGLEEKVRYDVIGSPFNNGGDNDKFQVVMYFNSSKGWVTKVVNESEYATEQGVSNIINNISPYTINTMLK
jgi:hypothetical protein